MCRFPEASDGSITTQFTMTTLEELGLLKMDFLGLAYPDGYSECSASWQKDRLAKTIDMDHIDYNDKAVLDSHRNRKVQKACSSWKVAGMKNFMKELKPQSLEDIIAGISLYRPGPMDFIPQLYQR